MSFPSFQQVYQRQKKSWPGDGAETGHPLVDVDWEMLDTEGSAAKRSKKSNTFPRGKGAQQHQQLQPHQQLQHLQHHQQQQEQQTFQQQQQPTFQQVDPAGAAAAAVGTTPPSVGHFPAYIGFQAAPEETGRSSTTSELYASCDDDDGASLPTASIQDAIARQQQQLKLKHLRMAAAAATAAGAGKASSCSAGATPAGGTPSSSTPSFNTPVAVRHQMRQAAPAGARGKGQPTAVFALTAAASLSTQQLPTVAKASGSFSGAASLQLGPLRSVSSSSTLRDKCFLEPIFT